MQMVHTMFEYEPSFCSLSFSSIMEASKDNRDQHVIRGVPQ